MAETVREIVAGFYPDNGVVPLGSRNANALISALSAAGYAVVPVEPDEETLARASKEFGDMQDDLPTMGWVRRAYKAMITVAQEKGDG